MASHQLLRLRQVEEKTGLKRKRTAGAVLTKRVIPLAA